ncbi:hypothetical protein WMY93_015725 [Mugilogobius chulae]|uniref:Uncharacterized protein n=1 Tax=Mugilogobius chulae TaxID=88201 RepID=A0AAW0NV95_9GOBI
MSFPSGSDCDRCAHKHRLLLRTLHDTPAPQNDAPRTHLKNCIEELTVPADAVHRNVRGFGDFMDYGSKYPVLREAEHRREPCMEKSCKGKTQSHLVLWLNPCSARPISFSVGTHEEELSSYNNTDQSPGL